MNLNWKRPHLNADFYQVGFAMSQRIQAIRGMPDILPKETQALQQVEVLWRALVQSYGYEEIRLPVVEPTALFKRSLGDATDIVEKEMFTFSDRDDNQITLRPEGTASCVRACLEHGLIHNQTQRLWYTGPMFRYERPQKGRYRQFYQIGVESFGFKTEMMEVEHLALCHRFWHTLAVEQSLSLEINSLGTLASRQHYKEVLVDYLTLHQEWLDEDSKRRLHSNPLRILDSKNPEMQSLIQDAPCLLEYLDEASRSHFERLQALLRDIGITFRVNPRLVRGLDYYNGLVYEWVTDKLGAQGTVCAGGRYDMLVEQLGGQATSAVGFAMGVERLMLLLEAHNSLPMLKAPDIYVIADPSLHHDALVCTEGLRQACPYLNIINSGAEGSLKSQFKKADKSGALIALIVGEDEWVKKAVGLKFLRVEGPQETIALERLASFLQNYFESQSR